MNPYILTALGVVAFIVIMAALSRKRNRRIAELEASEAALAKGADAPGIDEDWEAHEFGEEGRR